MIARGGRGSGPGGVGPRRPGTPEWSRPRGSATRRGLPACRAITIPELLEKVQSAAPNFLEQLRSARHAIGLPSLSQVELGVAGVLAVGFAFVLAKIFWSGDGKESADAPVTVSGEDRQGAGPGEGTGPVRWVNGALFGEFSSLTWLLILVSLLIGSSFPNNLLEDLLMS